MYLRDKSQTVFSLSKINITLSRALLQTLLKYGNEPLENLR